MSGDTFLGMEMKYWVVIGFIGQITFGARFIIQWICSEYRKESHIPVVFWYLSIVGGMILLMYAISRKDPVFIMGQSMGVVIYARNLRLIYKQNKRESRYVPKEEIATTAEETTPLSS